MWGHQETLRRQNSDRNSTETGTHIRMPFLSNFCRNVVARADVSMPSCAILAGSCVPAGGYVGHQETLRGQNHDRNSTETGKHIRIPFLSNFCRNFWARANVSMPSCTMNGPKIGLSWAGKWSILRLTSGRFHCGLGFAGYQVTS